MPSQEQHSTPWCPTSVFLLASLINQKEDCVNKEDDSSDSTTKAQIGHRHPEWPKWVIINVISSAYYVNCLQLFGPSWLLLIVLHLSLFWTNSSLLILFLPSTLSNLLHTRALVKCQAGKNCSWCVIQTKRIKATLAVLVHWFLKMGELLDPQCEVVAGPTCGDGAAKAFGGMLSSIN